MLELNKLYNKDFLLGCNDIDDKSIDLILVDPPYGTTKCSWDIIIPFEKMWQCYNRIIKDNGAILIFGTEPFSSSLRLSNLNMYRYDWYWNKGRAANFLFMNRQPGKIIETISVFYKKQPTYNPQKRINPKGPSKRHLSPNPSKISRNVKDLMGSESDRGLSECENQNFHGKNYEPDKLLPNNILEFTKPTKRLHPTEKPISLLEYLIKTYTNENNVVLDTCAGSASTLVATKNLNRKFIGFETNAEYFQSACDRIQQI